MVDGSEVVVTAVVVVSGSVVVVVPPGRHGRVVGVVGGLQRPIASAAPV